MLAFFANLLGDTEFKQVRVKTTAKDLNSREFIVDQGNEVGDAPFKVILGKEITAEQNRKK